MNHVLSTAVEELVPAQCGRSRDIGVISVLIVDPLLQQWNKECDHHSHDGHEHVDGHR